MPALSLVVCVFNERDFLERLLQKAEGCYDDLVVVHDGPDETNVRKVVEIAGGRFFERPHACQQEPHWPFAWGQAANDWILKLNADEFPSDEMKEWLQRFRSAPDPEPGISGFTCIWPPWNGKKAISKKCRGGRVLLFNRQRVKFFGTVEQAMVPDGVCQPLDFILHHQPSRKSYGFHNVLVRKQAYRWRAISMLANGQSAASRRSRSALSREKEGKQGCMCATGCRKRPVPIIEESAGKEGAEDQRAQAQLGEMNQRERKDKTENVGGHCRPEVRQAIFGRDQCR